MKITGLFLPPNGSLDKIKNKKQVPVPSQGQPGKVMTLDRIELSSKAIEMQRAKRMLQSIPDVREDKIAEIKKKLKDGTYEIDSEKIAYQMLTDAPFDKQT